MHQSLMYSSQKIKIRKKWRGKKGTGPLNKLEITSARTTFEGNAKPMSACLCLHLPCSEQQLVVSTVVGRQGLFLPTVFFAGSMQVFQEHVQLPTRGLHLRNG